jgi:hypothetical protein
MPAEKRYSCDDCDKSFVRPEHLYRHRLNHKPKRIYSCSSCPKTFVRRDLLNRHEKRHEQGMPANAGRTSLPTLAEQESQDEHQLYRQHLEQHASAEQQHMQHPPVNSLPLTPLTPLGAPPPPSVPPAHRQLPPPFPQPPPPPPAQPPVQHHYAPPPITSAPHHDMIQHSNGTHQVFFDPATDVQGVREDLDWLFSNQLTDANADTYYTAPWSNAVPPSLSPSSTNSFQGHDTNSSTPVGEWNEVRAGVLSALDLILPAPILQSSFFEAESMQNFCSLYFNNYNAHFPILHQPTFTPQMVPPLLMIAVLTLGATLSPDESHFETAERIQDSLRFLIFNSEAFSPPAPLWCLQALLLCQAQQKMFSTRKHHEMAHIFHSAIITLMRRGSSYSADRGTSQEPSSLDKAWRSWIDRELGLRAAYFAFVMDAQHASIFGHTPALSVSDLRLPLPCPDRLWDATSASRWKREQARQEDMPEFLPTLRAVLARMPLSSAFCAFSRFIILHGIFSLAKHMEARETTALDVGTNKLSLEDARSTHSGTQSEVGDGWKETLDRAIETWSFSLMSQEPSLCLEAARTLQRIAHVCLHVNLIDFHVFTGALAGSPSLTGNDITPAAFTRAQQRIQHWVAKPVAKKTLSHCFMMIQETLFSRHQYRAAEDNIALRPWCLYNGM